ncbi:MAG: S41 family peptidase [Candidatus Bruticola sp.]
MTKHIFKAASSFLLTFSLIGSANLGAVASGGDSTSPPSHTADIVSPSVSSASPEHRLTDLEEVSCDVLVQTFNILLDNAAAPPSPDKVWQFVYNGAAKYFQDNHLDDNWLKVNSEDKPSPNNKTTNSDSSPSQADQTAGLNRWQAMQKITNLYRCAVRKYPNLAQNPEFTVCLAQSITDSAEDIYTVFISLDQYSDMDNYLSGDYSGSLGVVLTPGRDAEGRSHFVVADLAPQSPASRAGLRRGDELTAINGEPLSSLTPTQCIKLMRGPNNSQVELTYITDLMRKMGRSDTRKILVTRSEVHFPAAWAQLIELDKHGRLSVHDLPLATDPAAEDNDCFEAPEAESLKNSTVTDSAKNSEKLKIGFLRVDAFGTSTNIEAERSLRALEKAECSGYILDLRGNPGGYTNAARDLCSKFLPEHSLVASLVDRNGQSEKTIYTYRNTHIPKPMAVLIDGRTASAAEITAGALRAHKAAFLVGTTSFGKNSSQKIYNFEFPPGETSACKVTYTHYRTPDDLDLGKNGLTPDFEVSAPFSVRLKPLHDPQLRKAAELLKKELSRQGNLQRNKNM